MHKCWCLTCRTQREAEMPIVSDRDVEHPELPECGPACCPPHGCICDLFDDDGDYIVLPAQVWTIETRWEMAKRFVREYIRQGLGRAS